MSEEDRDLDAMTARLAAVYVDGAKPSTGPIVLVEHDPAWTGLYAREAARIREVLGERVRGIEHVGSTSVPGLAAKPIVDIVLTVADSSDEGAYVTDLVARGYVLRIREPEWFEHRVFKGPDTDVNLHVFTDGCDEVARMIAFRDRLRGDAGDRVRYEATKRALAAQPWTYVQQYADAKGAVVREILARA